MDNLNILTNLFQYWPSVITLLAFVVALTLNKYWKSFIFTPFVLTLIFTTIVVVVSNLDYSYYINGNLPINSLLAPSVVALAVPLYVQLDKIKRYWREIIFVSFIASIIGMLSGVIIAIILGGDSQIVTALIPKSITTAIAVEIAAEIGGVQSITAISVSLAGMMGAIFGYPILTKLKIKQQAAIGMGMGAASHVLGTVACHEVNTTAGNFSSLALALCGVIGSIIAPFVSQLVIMFYA